MPENIRRRDFCARACRAASIVTLGAAYSGCEERLAAPSVFGVTPIVPAPGTTPPSGATPSSPLRPPPTSTVVVPLPIVPSTVAQRTLSVAIGAGSPLSDVWSAARTGVIIDLYPWDFLLMRTAPDAFTALHATCTHDGCLVSQVARPVFVCQCHGSRYDHTGTVVQGPAFTPLLRYQTRYENDALTFQF